MTLWICLSLLTLAVLSALAVPLLRPRVGVVRREDSNLAVYQDQLSALDAETRMGWLESDKVAAAGLEIQRRILGLRSEPLQDDSPGPAGVPWRLLVVLTILLPLSAFGLYEKLGAPALSEHVAAVPVDPEQAALTRMAADLAAKLKAHPDAVGSATLAETLFSLKRYPEAIDAFRSAIAGGQGDPEMFASLGEAYVLSNDGAVVPEAQQAFENALRLDHSAPRSRFYLGLARAQIGEFKEAVAIWRDLAAGSPPDAPWLAMLQEHIRLYAEQGGFDPASIAPVPPPVSADAEGNPHTAAGLPQRQPETAPATQEAMPSDADSAADQLTDEQAKQVNQMVEGLAARLQKEPGDFAGWIRLARSWTVLGKMDAAMDAAQHAVALHPESVEAQLTLADVQRASAKDHRLSDDFVATMQAVLHLDPKNPRALYALGLAAQQAGKTGDARRLWTDLRDSLPEDAPERSALTRQLATLPPG